MTEHEHEIKSGASWERTCRRKAYESQIHHLKQKNSAPKPSFWKPDNESLLWSRLTQAAPGCFLEYLTRPLTWFLSKTFYYSIICMLFQFFEQGSSQIPGPCCDHVNKSKRRHTERTRLPVLVCLDSS